MFVLALPASESVREMVCLRRERERKREKHTKVSGEASGQDLEEINPDGCDVAAEQTGDEAKRWVSTQTVHLDPPVFFLWVGWVGRVRELGQSKEEHIAL